MVDYRKGPHTVYDIKYHLVRVTQYRYKVLKGDLALRVRDLMRKICERNDVWFSLSNWLMCLAQHRGWESILFKYFDECFIKLCSYLGVPFIIGMKRVIRNIRISTSPHITPLIGRSGSQIW